MTAYDRWRDRLEEVGSQTKDHGERLQAQCPAHEDREPSLSITKIEGEVLAYCHAGCSTDDILDALDFTRADFYDEPRGRTYTYSDGRTVHRTPDKKFRQTGNTKGTALYRVETLDQRPEAQVYVVEGEKDVHALESIGATAVCPAMGAGKANRFDWSPLNGRDVTIVADDDEPGHKHAMQVYQLIEDVARTITIATARTGKDAADHVAAGYTLGDLQPVDQPGPKLWRATDLRGASQMRWLASRRIPRGAVSILVGDEGIGKSLLWVLLVAAITTGRELMEFGIPARKPENVLLVITEDHWSATVRPRLELLGADLSKITVICEEEDGSGSPVFPRDFPLVRRAIKRDRPSLVVLDAWVDTVDGQLKLANPQDARQALHPWKEIATAGDCSVLLLTHTNRERSGNARDKYGLTGELRKKVRMSLLAQLSEEGHLSVGPEKSNLVGPVPASLFKIEAVQMFPPTEDDDGTVPKLVHVGEDKRTSREILADSHAGESGDDNDEVDKWLLAMLANGPVKATEIYSAADANGFSKDQAKRAKKRLKVEAVKEGGGPWKWTVPELAGTYEWPDDLGGTLGEPDQGSKGADDPPVSDERSLAPFQVRGAPLPPEEGKGADEGTRGQPRSLGLTEPQQNVLGSLSADFGQDLRNITGSVPPRWRDQVEAILAQLVEEELVRIEGDRYFRINPEEKSA